MKRLILFGPPGSGKSTQANLICEAFAYVKISTGDLVRAEIEADTELGKTIKTYSQIGQLVPDDIIITMFKKRLDRGDIRNGYILDGYPRTVSQAGQLLKLPVSEENVIHFKIDPEEIVKRMTARLICSDCGAVYNRLFDLPKAAGICDNCQGKLETRVDDREETVRKRIKVYLDETMPVIEFYRQKKLSLEVDVLLDKDQIYSTLEGIVK